MALKIENKKIVGTIDNLEEKLSGEIPVTKEELLVLVNSWGRLVTFDVRASNNQILVIEECEAKECYDLSKLDTSRITDMDNIFSYSKFNGDISNWNTSNVTSMIGMFSGAKNFNQALKFDTSNVTSMSFMFHSANSFNQPLNFDTSKVTNMYGMFYNARVFNQELNFNASNVTSMERMFGYAESFNQPLNFETSKVTHMEDMFSNAKSFNQPLNFDTSSVTNMRRMFVYADAFIEKYNNGESLPNKTNEIKEWLNKHREKTNEIKANTINSKLDNNKNEFEQLIKEKNIPIDSKLYKELLSVYNQTQDKLKNDLDELKSKVVDIATKDFANIHL